MESGRGAQGVKSERSESPKARTLDARAPEASPPKQKLNESLVLELLAVEAVARPGNRFQALFLHRRAAVDADAVGACFEALERPIDQEEHLAVALRKGVRELLRVGRGGAVGHVLGRLVDRLLGDLAVL